MWRFVRIVDPVLAEDYSLRRLPALAFFRQRTPILYTGDINNQEEVFEFLFQNKHTAEEDVIVEDVDPERLEILINYVDFVVVLFYAVICILRSFCLYCYSSFTHLLLKPVPRQNSERHIFFKYNTVECFLINIFLFSPQYLCGEFPCCIHPWFIYDTP